MKVHKRYLPTYRADKVLDIPVSFFKELGIKAIFSDLDNTLAPYSMPHPDEETKAYVHDLLKEGIAFYITSNNHGGRVETFAKELGVEAAAMMLKPFGFRVKRFIRKKGYKFDEVILIGDQVTTDIRCANRVGIKSILVEHLSSEISLWTRPLVRKDRLVREQIKQKGLAQYIGDLTK